MITMQTLANFFGWMLLINFIVLLLAAGAVTLLRPWVVSVHARMTGVDAAALPAQYFQFMANYKIAVIMLNLAPYIDTAGRDRPRQSLR